MNPALILLPDFLLILSGFALRRSGMLSPAFWAEAEKFVYFILFPALLFRALARAELDFAASLPMLASGLLFTGAGFLLGNAAKPLFRLSQASFAAGNQGAYRFNTYVAFAVMVLRVKQPNRPRPFRTPFVWIVCPLAIAGTLLLFFNLSTYTLAMFFGWAAIGIIFYYSYGYRRSHLANGTEAAN